MGSGPPCVFPPSSMGPGGARQSRKFLKDSATAHRGARRPLESKCDRGPDPPDLQVARLHALQAIVLARAATRRSPNAQLFGDIHIPPDRTSGRVEHVLPSNGQFLSAETIRCIFGGEQRHSRLAGAGRSSIPIQLFVISIRRSCPETSSPDALSVCGGASPEAPPSGCR